LDPGEHQLRINDLPLDTLLAEPGAEAAIMNGNPRLWRGFGELALADIDMPDGRKLRLTAEAYTQNPNHSNGIRRTNYPVDMIFWSRTDEQGNNPFICVEPVVGVGSVAVDRWQNDQLVVPPRHEAVLRYTMQLLQ
jgi:hypothetical protein